MAKSSFNPKIIVLGIAVMKYNSNREISTVTYSSLLFKAGDLYGQIGGEICEFILSNNGHNSPFRCYLLPYLRCKKYILIFNKTY